MKELPQTWVLSTLGQLAGTGQYGWTTKAIAEGNIKFLRTTDITKGAIDWENVPFCYEAPSNKDQYNLRSGDILISRAGSVGFSVLLENIPFPAVFASYLIRYLPEKTIVIPRYLASFLKSQSYWKQIAGASSGIALANINASKLSELIVPLAPLNEQKRIADKLDKILARVDACRERFDHIPIILKRFRQAVLAAATSGKLTEEWRQDRNNEPWAKTGISVYGDEILESVASSWIWKPFAEVAEITSNLVDPKILPESIHLAPNHIESGSGRILEVSNVQKDKVKSSKHKFYNGQIVYSKIRPYLNKVVLVNFDGVCSADMYPINATINARYLLIWMLSVRFVEWASQKQGRVVLPKINQNALNKIPVPVPPIEEQTEIVRRVEELFAYADRIETRYQTARAQVDKLTPAVLAKAFRGELVPQDPNDEPASVLLERIERDSVHNKVKSEHTRKKRLETNIKSC